ncbi:hypothetical protein CYLTODRAFT_425274 [Cylindrobasidium torrendii FP15055 ss-10]|uniref:Uncharacterized protein n=1 Tax=Cylindrobasidium torrendii FP15055 ss-10 TaxID=1314674 RepID=A0A0D7B2E7_9AGAR|nr:hypothetical protein CYLTODRAFT_425274 [Cylindrobasidium torrendii FP15055 ss-10]
MARPAKAEVKRVRQDTYNRLMYAKNRGFSSYNPVPRTGSHYSDVYYPTGAQVGDLAIHRTDGTVSYLGFNVTLPVEAPRNLNNGEVRVRLKDYSPVTLEEGVDYLRDDSRYPTPCVIGGTNDLQHPFETTDNEEDGPIRSISISAHAREGGYLALPCGATLYECTDVGARKLQRWALDNALALYDHYAGKLDVENGDMFVTTGCLKMSHYGLGVYYSRNPNYHYTGRRLFYPAPGITDFSPAQELKRTDNARDGTEVFDYTTWSDLTGPIASHPRNCTATWRGFRISISPSIYNTYITPRGFRKTLWRMLPTWLRPHMESFPMPKEMLSPCHDPCREIVEQVYSQHTRIQVMLMHDDDLLPVLDTSRDAVLPGTYELLGRLSKTHYIVVDSDRRALFKPQSDFILTWTDRIHQFWCWLFTIHKSRLIPLIYREHY